MFIWLRRESIALLAEAATALTVLAQLSHLWPMSAWLAHILDQWRIFENAMIGWPFKLTGVAPHPHIAGALAAALFLTMLGIGARQSRRLQGRPLPPVGASMRWFDDMTWPSLIVFALIAMSFLFGQTGDPSQSPPLTVFGSRHLGKYSYALIITTGYWAGDFLGHREFHHRLYRLACLTAAILLLDQAAQLLL